jgi:hypothetical protein
LLKVKLKWKKNVEEIIHSVIQLGLKIEDLRIVEWDLDVAGESRGGIVTHWTEAKLKFVWLSEG